MFCLMIISCKKEKLSSDSNIAVGESYDGGIMPRVSMAKWQLNLTIVILLTGITVIL